METPLLETLNLARLPLSVPRPFRTVVVLGAGTMGAQIAAQCANAGLTVHLLDIAAPEGPKNSLVEAAFKRMQALKPDPLFTVRAAQRITLGNFDEHFDRVAEADWVVEAVVERLDIKRDLLARVETIARPDAVITTNTSGIPIHALAEGRSEAFRQRFFGTHFFNPPRYLRLFEVIPTVDTDPALVERMAHFARVHLGKGIVIAHDVPYFIGNRIGIYGMMGAMQAFLDGGYTIEEIDALTGPLVGHPSSATFRTADVVGLDVLRDVLRNLHAAATHDERRDAFAEPALLRQLVENKALGAKTGAGFYRKAGKEILSINPATGQYEPARPLNLPGLDRIREADDLPTRLRLLYADTGRVGAFFRKTTLDLLAYSACRIPEVTDSPASVDKAICWGFGWEMGPFAMWDALGFAAVVADMDAAGIDLPAWVRTMQAGGHTAFYQGEAVYVPAHGSYVADPRPADEYSLAAIKSDKQRIVWKNADAHLVDLGDGVVLYEFRSKANTLGQFVTQGLMEVIDRVEQDRDLRGLVVGNEGKNFSVGANLGEAAMAVATGQFEALEQIVAGFQQAILRVRYAEKPVVVAVHQRVLGGACELLMACPHPVAAAESYIGLVEVGVGLIPGGTGTTHLAALASEKAANGHPSEIMAFLQKYFEQMAMAKVSMSARQAQEMDYLPAHAQVVMNAERRLYVAKEAVLRLSNAGYLPPPRRTAITVLGRQAGAALQVGAYQFLAGRYISEYDYHLAQEIAWVLTGGDLSGPQEVPEDYLLALEREALLRCAQQPKTQERISYLLMHNKPLRN
jgi:3-hydroxyacyl-CoA dehydrogenase